MKSVLLLNSSVRELNFINKLNIDPNQNKHYELQVRSEYNMNFGNDNSHAIAHLKQFIEITNNPELFSLTITCDGIVQTDSFESEDEKKHLHVQGYYLLFPIVASLINHIFVSAGLPSLVLSPNAMDESSVTIQ